MPFVFLIAFLLAGFIAVKHLYTLYSDSKKASDGIINYDKWMRTFIYKVYDTKEEIISKLEVENGLDKLRVKIDKDHSFMTFSDFRSHSEYIFEIIPYKDFYILKITRLMLISGQTEIPVLMNPFITKKLDAEPYPYIEYINGI